MLDSFALAQMFARPPNINYLQDVGWRVFYKPNGDFSRLGLSEREANDPKLTVYSSPKGFWYINASVCLTSWLEGSNVRLIDASELPSGLEMLSEYVEEKSEIFFDAMNAKVKKVEFTNNFTFETSRMNEIISALKKSEFSRYVTKPYQTGVSFENEGKEKNQLIKIYSKYHECLKKKKNKSVLETARNILRFEAELQNKAIYYLAKSLRLPDHTAKYILTKQVSDAVIERKMKLINFDKYLRNETRDILEIFRNYNKSYADKLISFLALESKFGKRLYEIPELQISKRTCQKYKSDCSKVGVLSFG